MRRCPDWSARTIAALSVTVDQALGRKTCAELHVVRSRKVRASARRCRFLRVNRPGTRQQNHPQYTILVDSVTDVTTICVILGIAVLGVVPPSDTRGMLEAC